MDTPSLKEYLIAVVLQLTVGVVLLDELPPRRSVQRMQTLALATTDAIKDKLEGADETYQRAMVIQSRANLRRIMDTLLMYPFPTKGLEARREWLDTTKHLLKQTEGYSNG